MKRINRLSEEDEGAIGIGTLIVFIGLILVAAIASAVIVGVMGNLQERAKKTGRETQENVAPPLRVQHAVGYHDGDIQFLNFTVSAIEGSNGYDLKNLLIDITGMEDDATAGFNVRYVNDSATSGDINNQFSLNWLTADKSYPSNTFLASDELVEISVPTTGTEAPDAGPLAAADTSTDLSIKFMASSGSPPTLYETNTPSEYPTTGEFELP